MIQDWKKAHKMLVMLLTLVESGCAREACYARNDAAFLEAVDSCDDRGLTYYECPEIPDAERRQKEADARCP